jgi:glycoprotein endo-alpha-1,2-mannosidase
VRRLILCFAIGVALAASAQALAGTTSIFFYPWYSTPDVDGFYKHWDRNGHQPPADLASSFYPVRGVYSSSDLAVLRAQMREIAAAGIDEVVSSWWGVGSPEDRRLPAVIEAARAEGLRVAAQLEPYDEGRTPTSVAADITRLRDIGITRIYVYRPFDIDPVSWLTLISGARGVEFFAQSASVPWVAAAGFAGVYTYDIVTFGASSFARLCARAHAAGLACAPSVGPGYDALRANGDRTQRPRRNGATYDAMWQAAIRAGSDLVTITSYNEWHEGTQIEPARTQLPRGPAGAPGQAAYETYEGAYGLHGRAGTRAYLVRTAFWTRQYRAVPASARGPKGAPEDLPIR